MSYCKLNLTLDIDSVRMFSTVIFQIYFSCDNDIWIATIDYYLYQGGIIFLTVCLFVCLCVSRITQMPLVGSSRKKSDEFLEWSG